MRILASAIALAVALALPNVGEASSKKSTARSTATVQQKHVKRTKAKRVRTTASAPVRREQRPCAGYLWWGCVGWDPDPNVRSTLVRDLADSP